MASASIESMFSDPHAGSKRHRFGIAGLDRGVDQKREIRQKLSTGRHDPVFPQTIVADKAQMVFPPSEETANTLSGIGMAVMAPTAQNPSLMGPKHGEWAMRMLHDPGAVRAPYSGGLWCEKKVFTCGNDVPIDYPLVFAGIVTNAQDLSDPNRDDAGGLDIGGTVSGINTGPDTLFAGDTVWIGLPWMVQSADGRGMIPGVKMKGAPEDKAYFGTYRLRWRCVDDAVLDVRMTLEKIYKSTSNRAQFTDEGTLDAHMSRDAGVRKDMPIRDYMVVTAHQIHLRDLMIVNAGNANVTNDLTKALNKLLEFLLETEDKQSKQRAMYDEALGMDALAAVYAPTRLRGLGKLSTIAGAVTIGDATEQFVVLMDEADRAKEIASGRMHDFLLAQVMGKVLTTSESGCQLDVNLGQFMG